ncbi:hypothetical protein F5144DRAFT_85605 [Chaetomium tenue]|uniref:Uncharacterized protein n=1 Tax=Chaetomium tenue TaxID=1854479 RepID=A0ACB7PQD5_9PEZI|nr:hypothetical protein F5144DRAFT_85605 [Chaetomium globosum]
MHSTASSKTAPPTVSAAEQFLNARRLFNAAYSVGYRHFVDPNALAFLHVTLVFIYHLTFFPKAMAHVAPEFWEPTASMLNGLMDCSQQTLASLLEGDRNMFPRQGKGMGVPERRLLPEDWALRGFPFIEGYYSNSWLAPSVDLLFTCPLALVATELRSWPKVCNTLSRAATERTSWPKAHSSLKVAPGCIGSVVLDRA